MPPVAAMIDSRLREKKKADIEAITEGIVNAAMKKAMVMKINAHPRQLRTRDIFPEEHCLVIDDFASRSSNPEIMRTLTMQAQEQIRYWRSLPQQAKKP